MKKSFLLLLVLILISIHAMSQEKGAYLTISGGIGPTGFRYKMTGVNFTDPQQSPKRNILLGGQAGLGFSYYFTKHLGVSVGAGVSHYRTRAKLMGDFTTDKYLTLGEFIDNDPVDGHITNYQLRVRTQDWVERQSTKFFEIPITLNLQKKFKEKERFGVYFAAGVKLQFPFGAKYWIVDGENEEQHKLNVSGFYPERNLELGRYNLPDVSQHGFGKIHNPGEVLTYSSETKKGLGKLDLKFNLSLIGEAGFLITLSRRVDLTLGAFIDIGLLNINKHKDSEDELFLGSSDYVDVAQNYNVGKGIVYNSIIHSKYVDKVKTIGGGGKLGLRIKLGKLSKKEDEPVLPPKPDTVYIQPQQPDLDSLLNAILAALDSLNKQPPAPPAPAPPVEEVYDYYPGIYADADMNILFEPIYFDLDKSILTSESIKILNAKAAILNKYPEIKLLVYGNTCDLGKDDHNYKLGQRRAEAAKQYLIGKGIDPERFETSTLSKFNPELPNINEDNRRHNRRDDFKPLFLQKK